jgi:hypothetical protein
MRQETKLLKELLNEAKKTNCLIKKMNHSLSLLNKRLSPERHSCETISTGGPVTEITVRSPKKLEEWKNLFESKGLRVEYYEPFRTDGNHYFAKLWGYLKKSKDRRTGSDKVLVQ